MSSGDRLTIGRASTTFVVPRGHPAPDALRRRGEEALRDHLASTLAGQLARIVPHHDRSVWIVRQLSVDFPFAADVAAVPALAADWSREIVQSLTRTLRAGEGVTRFASRAAFLAQYLSDVAAGRDSGCWYYEQFDSLAALPAGAKIRETLVREPAVAAEVLLDLARSLRLEPLLGVLAEPSARAIYDCAFPAGEPPLTLSPRMIERLLAAADALTERGPDGSIATAKNAIRLTASMLHQVQHLVPADVRAHVDRLLGFASVLANTPEPWRFVEAVIDGDTRAVSGMSGGPFVDLPTFEAFIRLARERADLVTCAAGTLRPRGEVRPVPGEVIPTARAGLALLLEPLAEAGVCNGTSPEDAAMRARLAVQCAGAARALETISDPMLRLFAGLEWERRDIDAFLTAPPDEMLRGVVDDVLRRFAARLFGFAGSSVEYLYANFLAGNGTLRLDRNRIDVDLPPVPLEVVLRLAGMHQKQIVVPWLADHTITLRLGAST